MKVRVCPRGYTIVEVMIFLAVSGGLFISAALVMSGQQQKTQFAQAIRDIESEIQDVLNDVSTGYYANTNNFTCTASASGLTFPAGTSEQGANEGCIFLGRVIQFTKGEEFNIFTVAGRRQVVVGLDRKEVQNLGEAQPTAIAPTIASPGTPSAIESKMLSYGLTVVKMEYNNGATTDIGAVGFFSSLGKYDSGNLVSGAQRVDLLPIDGSALTQNTLEAAKAINDNASSSPLNPEGGVIICFKSGSTNQHGVITIGSNGRQLSTSLEIKGDTC